MDGQRNDHGKRSQHSQSDYGGGKRRNHGDDPSDQHTVTNEDTVYRYLCPLRKIGSIIGKGGEIAKQLRADSKSNIRISEAMPGYDERVVTIFSSSEETNLFGDTGEYVCPAQDALFMVHDRVIAEDLNNAAAAEEEEDRFGEVQQVTVRMLVPTDQIGCVIGKGGQVIQNIRSETRAQIRITKDEHLPPLALSTDELLLIQGEPSVVRKALYQVATRLHENPSRSQHLLLSSSANTYQSGGMFVTANAGAPLLGLYGNYKGSWSSSFYPDQRDEASAKDFSLRLVCPIANIGGVIGKGGGIIKQIRQESRASIKVDSSGAEGNDCIIFISAKEFFEDQSPIMNAALRLQPRCSEKTEKEPDDSVITTRLLVGRSQIGCLMGKGGAIISEMRNLTRANIRIISEDNLPKVAGEDDEMVQITGSLEVASNALLQVILRLKANIFGRDGALTTFPPALPYIPVSLDTSDGPEYGSRDRQSRGRGYSSSSSGYGSRDVNPSDNYGSNRGPLIGGEGSYGAYGGFSSGRSSGAGFDASTIFICITSRYVSLLLVFSKQDVCTGHDLAALLLHLPSRFLPSINVVHNNVIKLGLTIAVIGTCGGLISVEVKVFQHGRKRRARDLKRMEGSLETLTRVVSELTKQQFQLLKQQSSLNSTYDGIANRNDRQAVLGYVSISHSHARSTMITIGSDEVRMEQKVDVVMVISATQVSFSPNDLLS
ncbi:hypothetical protein D5086_016166 [Populus alba]|uniref:Uncharacterized protein n=1 Tax=Populus alba TaxID=43335 RepID=A0ACC4BT86_POPAL